MTCQGYKFLSLTEMCHPSANVYDDHIEGSYHPSGMTGTAYGVISVRYFRFFLFHSPCRTNKVAL